MIVSNYQKHCINTVINQDQLRSIRFSSNSYNQMKNWSEECRLMLWFDSHCSALQWLQRLQMSCRQIMMVLPMQTSWLYFISDELTCAQMSWRSIAVSASFISQKKYQLILWQSLQWAISKSTSFENSGRNYFPYYILAFMLFRLSFYAIQYVSNSSWLEKAKNGLVSNLAGIKWSN